MRRWIVLAAAVLGVAAVVSVFSSGFGRDPSVVPSNFVSEPAPDLAGPTLDGGTYDLDRDPAKVVLVNVWASWCPPCRDEAPTLERAWQRYRGRGVVLVGLDVWDGEQDARDFLRRFGVTYPNGPDTDGSAAIGYGLTGIPETYFIRPDGTMARHWVGPLTDQQIEAFIEELLP